MRVYILLVWKYENKYWSSSELVSGIVAIWKNDLSHVKVFTDYFNVDHKTFLLFLALACKRSEFLEDNYKAISDILEIGSENAIKIMFDVHWGYNKLVSKLAKENDMFTNADHEITRQILFMTKWGYQIRDNQSIYNIPSSIKDNLKPIIAKMIKVFGIEENCNEENDDTENLK